MTSTEYSHLKASALWLQFLLLPHSLSFMEGFHLPIVAAVDFVDYLVLTTLSFMPSVSLALAYPILLGIV